MDGGKPLSSREIAAIWCRRTVGCLAGSVGVFAVFLCAANTAAGSGSSGSGNPGSPIDPGGGTSASAGASSRTGGIFANVEAATRGKPGRSGKSRCVLTPGNFGGLRYPVADPKVAPLEMTAPDGVTVRLFSRRCDDEYAWVWVPQVTARTLANEGFDKVQRLLRKPRGVFAPIATVKGLATVNEPLWFAVPREQWKPVSATVTAKPVRLILDAGNGGGKSCIGPGPLWHAGMAEPATEPSCSYEYPDASTVSPDGKRWAARLTLRWHVTWAATNGAGGGDLGTVERVSDYPLSIGEIEATETHAAASVADLGRSG